MVTTFSKRARTRSILVLFALIIGLLFSFWFLFARTRPLIVLSINAPSTEMFCFTPDSQAVVIANKNNLNIWNIDTNKLEAVLGGHDQAIKSIIASSTGELLVSVDEAGVFCFWDVSVRRRHVPARSNECLGEMGSGFRVSPKQGGHDILACLSPHGKWLAVKTLKEIVICDIQSGDKVASVRSDDFKTIESIVFSPKWRRTGVYGWSWQYKYLGASYRPTK